MAAQRPAAFAKFTAGMIALSVSAASPIPVTPALAQADSQSTNDYAPARWVQTTTPDGAPCRAVQSVELGRLACVSEARDALLRADQEIYSHGFYTRDDLGVLTRAASFGIVAAANHICDIAQHPDSVADPDVWRAQCLHSRQAASSAVQATASEIAEETQNAEATERARSAGVLADDQRREDASKAAIAREDAQYERDLAAFRASFRMRKSLGESVCVEGIGAGIVTREGFIDRIGQVERIAGARVLVRYHSNGTPGIKTETRDDWGFTTSSQFTPGTPGGDHLEWRNANEVGLCRFITPAIQRHECAGLEQAVGGIPIIGSVAKGVNMCAAFQDAPH